MKTAQLLFMIEGCVYGVLIQFLSSLPVSSRTNTPLIKVAVRGLICPLSSQTWSRFFGEGIDTFSLLTFALSLFLKSIISHLISIPHTPSPYPQTRGRDQRECVAEFRDRGWRCISVCQNGRSFVWSGVQFQGSGRGV